MQLNNFDVDFKIDTGSDVNVVSEKLLKRINPNSVIEGPISILKSFGGTMVKALGSYRLKCIHHNMARVIDIVVVDFDTIPIMGLQSCIDFRLIDISHNARLERLKRMNRFF